MKEQPLVLDAAKVLMDSYFNGTVVSFNPSSTQNFPYVNAATVRQVNIDKNLL